jgi:hypothetical protein
MRCPKCRFEQPSGNPECARCGVVFAKWHQDEAVHRAPQQQAAVPDPAADEDDVQDGRIGRKELTILGSGLAAAAVVYAVPFTRLVFSALVTLFHELGHTVVGWLFGYPSLPAFDLVYGGGFTHMGEFHRSIAMAIGAGFAFAGWTFRRNARTLAVISVIAAVWLVFVSAEWRRELIVAAAGHAGEFILAGILFYQALAGVGWRIPELERPLGAFAAFFVQIHSMLFAVRLRNDPGFLAWYREGKGGALMNDLEVVALDLNIYLGFNPGIRGVAGMLVAFSVVPFSIALVWYLFRRRSHRFVESLLEVS